jgi:hypothetical protein
VCYPITAPDGLWSCIILTAKTRDRELTVELVLSLYHYRAEVGSGGKLHPAHWSCWLKTPALAGP